MRQHIFKDPTNGELYDENGDPVNPDCINDTLIGIQALRSYSTIEDSVSRALGLGPTIDYR